MRKRSSQTAVLFDKQDTTNSNTWIHANANANACGQRVNRGGPPAADSPCVVETTAAAICRFDRAIPGPRETSKAAAAATAGSVYRGKVGRILQAVTDAGESGLTRNEVARRIGCGVHTITSGVLQLVQSGLVVETNVRRVDPETKCQGYVLIAGDVGGHVDWPPES